MITLTPIQLQSILNAAMLEIRKDTEAYQKTLPKVFEIHDWLHKINWDEPTKPVIMIDELPF